MKELTAASKYDRPLEGTGPQGSFYSAARLSQHWPSQ